MTDLTTKTKLILLAQNTMLSALIDAAPKAEPQAVVSSVALRVLVVNFTAIHTSVMVRLRFILLKKHGLIFPSRHYDRRLYMPCITSQFLQSSKPSCEQRSTRSYTCMAGQAKH